MLFQDVPIGAFFKYKGKVYQRVEAYDGWCDSDYDVSEMMVEQETFTVLPGLWPREEVEIRQSSQRRNLFLEGETVYVKSIVVRQLKDTDYYPNAVVVTAGASNQGSQSCLLVYPKDVRTQDEIISKIG